MSGKVIIERENMENIASKIRTTLGTNNLMHITELESNLDDFNNEIAIQTNLIAQISEVLDGKAGTGGGSSVETCTVSFPYNGSGGTYKLGYTDEDCKFIQQTFSSSAHTIIVVKGTTVISLSDTHLFNGTFDPGSNSILLADNILVIEGNTTLSYADDAPV